MKIIQLIYFSSNLLLNSEPICVNLNSGYAIKYDQTEEFPVTIKPSNGREKVAMGDKSPKDKEKRKKKQEHNKKKPNVPASTIKSIDKK